MLRSADLRGRPTWQAYKNLAVVGGRIWLVRLTDTPLKFGTRQQPTQLLHGGMVVHLRKLLTPAYVARLLYSFGWWGPTIVGLCANTRMKSTRVVMAGCSWAGSRSLDPIDSIG